MIRFTAALLAATALIQQGAEERFGVETGNAHPPDAAIETDQRRSRAVADESEVGQRRVTAVHLDRAVCRIGLEHEVVPS